MSAPRPVSVADQEVFGNAAELVGPLRVIALVAILVPAGIDRGALGSRERGKAECVLKIEDAHLCFALCRDDDMPAAAFCAVNLGRTLAAVDWLIK